ncbi:MAG: adenylate/guanylate cyclase domain-containing protein [Nitrospinales bacterium]
MPKEQKVTRKLRAILSADVKGYSLLMADDEVHTIQTLKIYRQIMSDLLQHYSGRVVDNPGDNLLAEFGSAVDAVECAYEIQNRLKKENAKFVENKQLQFRIGINIGDVVQDGDRIYGSGVNVAARIEGIADAGGVCISRNTYNQIKDKLSLGYEYLGKHEVKNISDPVVVYKVLMDMEKAGKLIGLEKKKSKLKLVLMALTMFIILSAGVIGGLYLKYYYLPNPTEIDPENRMTLDVSQGPSIAILPFVNMSGDPKQDTFCDGITENITTALAHVRQLFVIARNSSFSYKGKSISLQQIGHELGVQYLIKGSVQQYENNIRITVQLIETESGNHIWSEIYDQKLEDIFKLQDEITINIIKTIGIRLSDGQQIRKLYEGVADLQIYIKFLKAWKYFHRFNKEGNDLARKEIMEIMELDNKIPFIYSLLGFIYMNDIFFGSCESSIVCFGKATEAARKALSLDEFDHKAHQLTGYIFLMRKEYENAIEELKYSINLNPNCADCYLVLGQAYWSYDLPHDSLDYIKKAFLLNPKPPSNYYATLGFAYIFTKENEDAMEAFKNGIAIEPNDIFSHLGLAAVYAILGHDKDAKKEGLEILKIDPSFSLNKFKKIAPLKSSDELNRVTEALRMAGLR